MKFTSLEQIENWHKTETSSNSAYIDRQIEKMINMGSEDTYLSDSANDHSLWVAKSKKREFIELLNNGGEFSYEFYGLVNSENELVSSGSSVGRWGKYFRTSGGPVSIPKRESTLEKKGLYVAKVKRNGTYDFNGRSSKKGNPLFDDVKQTSINIERVNYNDFREKYENSEITTYDKFSMYL